MPKEGFEQFENLKSKEGVVAYIKLSTSEQNYLRRCKNVQKANFGNYPLYWVEAVVNSGLVEELYKSWAGKKAEGK
ncbi:MAG: hypothetical protein US45_C0020G0004 [Candidatus Nomurabacteria bacterium GW2011_GWA1_37_20]|uniref:Uncharacterized protein n=2 Tax=Parcubacteria group TaxID=1794811 RepID=A0A0G0L4P3_9BACT|nr:MAG: hypothetical protein US33_C0051G0005 [Parcubacteria group bacterium GW2011_GWC1_36_9]KKQ28037.1 MAG: hypothetical protein US41_C0010G0005 [Parcubacteria group bacterium GW2011_GWB1_37_13]KKQ32403.1 MAG: hypothetical protein US45_C0020G0004 [Candidatus Nomurabacteria bacterium GW2011_GWA1_37_20]KKQ47596.1 MAG: hypothetical protein US65_C0007G0006 [Candidatus Yanofskybacteria bacterium GW2011_GWC2_37_9]